MESNIIGTLLEMFRSSPVQTGLVTVVPFAIAVVQLMNSLVNGLSVAVSVPFAVVLLAFAVFLTRYQLAQYRLTQLQRETAPYPAD